MFIFNMLAGSIINQLNTIFADPTTIFTTLGIAIPQTATFFITYIVVAGG